MSFEVGTRNAYCRVFKVDVVAMAVVFWIFYTVERWFRGFRAACRIHLHGESVSVEI